MIWDTDKFINMARPAIDAGVIDILSLQAHGLESLPASQLRSTLNRIADLGLPIYISEYDVQESNEQRQLDIMREQFPVFYDHSSVKGIRLWGYVVGTPWRDGTGLVRQDGSFRPAMTWLMDYLESKR